MVYLLRKGRVILGTGARALAYGAVQCSRAKLLNVSVHCPLAAGEPSSLPSACSEHNTWAGAMCTSQSAMWWHRNGWIKVVPRPPLPWASMNSKMVSPLLETPVQGDLGHVTCPIHFSSPLMNRTRICLLLIKLIWWCWACWVLKETPYPQRDKRCWNLPWSLCNFLLDARQHWKQFAYRLPIAFVLLAFLLIHHPSLRSL